MPFSSLQGKNTPFSLYVINFTKTSAQKTISLKLIIFFVFSKTTTTQPVFTCLKLTTKTLEQGVKYVQS